MFEFIFQFLYQSSLNGGSLGGVNLADFVLAFGLLWAGFKLYEPAKDDKDWKYLSIGVIVLGVIAFLLALFHLLT